MTSATVETKVIGDVDGQQTGDAGEVIWTAYTTNDTTTPSTSSTCNLNLRDFLTFQNILFYGGNTGASVGSCIYSNGNTSTNITLRDCTFIGGATGSASETLVAFAAADTALHWLVDRCVLINFTSGAMTISVAASTTTDTDIDFTVQNCRIISWATGIGINFTSTGAGTHKPGGLHVNGCTLVVGQGACISNTSGNLSTSVLSTVNNCILMGSTGITATLAATITEDSNYFAATTARTNVTAGANSQTFPTYAMMLEFGQAVHMGRQLRHWLEPAASSVLATLTSSTAAPSVDLANRPRPASGGVLTTAAGALERHDTGVKETGTVDAGGVGLSITGPGDHDFNMAVTATATTFTIRAQYDSNHAATNKPQVILQANGEIGVSSQTVTMTAAVNTWETLTVGPFTPTAAGYVTLRLVSRSAAANGKAFFDTAKAPSIDLGDLAYYRRAEPLRTFDTPTASGLKEMPSLEGL